MMHYSRWQRHGDVGSPDSGHYRADAVCSIDGCDRSDVVGRHMCGMHYSRWRKRGTTDDPTPSSLDRFMSKVDRSGPGECWIWTGAKSNAGYGTVRIDYQQMPAHRAAYELLVGPVPDGLELDHLCVNPPCVNPAHLDPVTHAENMRRGPTNVAGRNAAKTECPQGHPYDDENTLIRANGNRVCRTCDNARSRASYYRRKSLRG